MPPDPSKMDDVDTVRRLMANAKRLGNEEVTSACRIRIYELSGSDTTDPLERRLWQAVAAYEETLREKQGRKQPAAYTRRNIEAKGAVQTLTDWALEPKVTPGFEALVASGAARFTGEHIVVDFADRFPPAAVEAARRKLLAHGVQQAE